MGFGKQLDRLRDALALVFLGALTGMLVSATIGTGVLMLSGALPAGGFWPTWSVWWTGDAMGVLLVTPLLLALSSAHRPKDVQLAHWVEGGLLSVSTVVVAVVATNQTSSLLFLVFPILAWAAVRFHLAGATLCALPCRPSQQAADQARSRDTPCWPT